MEIMCNDPQNVATVATTELNSTIALHLHYLIRASVKVTGVDPSRIPLRPTNELYTIRASALWVATHMLPIRPVRCAEAFNISRACVTESIQAANIARQLQANTGRLDYILLVTIAPKMYAAYCTWNLPPLPTDYPRSDRGKPRYNRRSKH